MSCGASGDTMLTTEAKTGGTVHGRKLATVACGVAIALSAGLALVACGGSGSSASPAQNFGMSAGWSDTNGGEKTVARSVSIQAGGEAYIIESDNPTTGYQWHFAVPPGVSQVSSEFTGPSPSASPLVGAGGTRTITFRVLQPGTYVVVGTYARPWEPKKPAKTVRLSIYANPASWAAPGAVFTARDSPGALGTEVGTTFVVDLADNPSTGYTWTMKLGPGLALLHDQVVTPVQTSPAMVGVPGQHLWFIKVEKAGTTAVTGIYARPSDAATKNAAAFSMKVVAK
jgi:inhibitor of cysteine peptidase